jgi:hypothetical protein
MGAMTTCVSGKVSPRARAVAPGGRWFARMPLERAVESGLGLVAHPGGDGRDAVVGVAQKLPGDLQSPPGEILHRRLSEEAPEPVGKRRPRQSDGSPEPLDAPRVGRIPCISCRALPTVGSPLPASGAAAGV